MPAALPALDISAPLCCAPIGSGSFDSDTDAVEVAARLRVLADANRIRIVQALSCCEGHHLTTGEVASLLDVTPATASHHLKQLAAAGLLRANREGTSVHHRLNLGALGSIAAVLDVRCGADCACA